MKYVYMLRVGGRYYKVGISAHVLNRIKDIQTGNAEPVQLVTIVPTANPPHAEKELHEWLSEHKTNGGSEWFELNPEAALELVMKIANFGSSKLNKFLTLRNLLYRQEIVEKKFIRLVESVNRKLESLAALRQAAPPIIAVGDAEVEPEAEYVTDPLYDEAVEIVRLARKASASLLQRRLRVGYARAARLLDELEEGGIVSSADGARAREVLNTEVVQPHT